MFLVTLTNNGVPTIVHGTNHKVSGGRILFEKNSIGSFSFSLNPANPGYECVFPLATEVEVKDTLRGATLFEGRVVKVTPKMSDSGSVVLTVNCEDMTAFLLDSIQPYLAERQWANPLEYVSYLLEIHNGKMPEHKRVYPGVIDLQTYETSDGLFKGIQRDRTWSVLQADLVETFGGEMRVRRASDGLLYLDYSERLGETRATKLKLGRNIKSSRREVDPSDVITRLYPLGAKLTITETDEYGNITEVETEERLTIASVNNGVEYIDNEIAIEEYGIIEGIHEWDDVMEAASLLAKGKAWLGESGKVPISTTITAIDLSLLGIDIDSFKLYDWYPCENNLISLDDTLEIVKHTIKLDEPQKPVFELGKTKELSSKKIASVGSLSKVVESVKSQQQTAINNLQNSVRATKASIQVLDNGIVSRVEETVTTVVKDLDIKDGEDATTLRIDSSRGTVFKNSEVSTILNAVIYKGGNRITDVDALRAEFGTTARLEWAWQRMDEDRFGVISASDSRISQGGFAFTLSPEDVDTKVVFMCSLITE